jgi:hypothetical protein
MAWVIERFNLFRLFFPPGPSLHIAAVATSLRRFINVSGQPHSCKRLAKTFSG